MHTISMKRPASWPGELWREALPMGNGLTSALLTGTVGCEHFLVNRFDRWEESADSEIPDVSHTLEEARALLRAGEFTRANMLLRDVLAGKGYCPALSTPTAPVEIRLRFESEAVYRRYRRGVNMDTGEAFVRYEQNGVRFERRAFVSRAEDQAVLLVKGGAHMTLAVDKPADERLFLKILLPGGGELLETEEGFKIDNAASVLLLARFDRPPAEGSYEALFERHLPLYQLAAGEADLSLSEENRTVEELLDIAHEEEAPRELYEKLWRFGRYLFVSGTAEGGNPFPLYGLWGGATRLPWAQNVANENVQMIYWHAPAGGYAHLLRPLIDYYFQKMDVFREAAKKLFGCRGIYVSTYTTPRNSAPAPNVSVIVNYIGCAGWLCRHFYDYYRYTQDKALLKAKILPFMLEAAQFYEDYAVWDENGRLMIIPSVSPENTPGNFMPPDFQEHMGHVNPVVWNATMDFAIIKELFTNLIALSGEFPLEKTRVEGWRKILADMPGYMVNADGAVREWMDEKFSDFYRHRHLSHLYPLFPGEEVDKDHALFAAFERAVELRELGGLSGWAFSHMAAVYARLGRGNKALSCLNTLAKGCLLPNLFTLHNDWRDMGVSVKIDMYPVQLDALMGAVNAVQEMLMRYTPDKLRLLPACPDAFGKGCVKNRRFPGGRISFEWNAEEKTLKAEITAEQQVCMALELPAWCGRKTERICVNRGESAVLSV